jgi:hypothetical protein
MDEITKIMNIAESIHFASVLSVFLNILTRQLSADDRQQTVSHCASNCCAIRSPSTAAETMPPA